MVATMRCFACGAVAPETSRFCGNCGRQISDPNSDTILDESASSDALLDRLRRVLTGEYRVEREVARGGMGIVFQATEESTGRSVALKVLSPELGLTTHAAERFKREGRLVAELDHPNIVPVYRVGQIGGILFIAMRFIDGRSLDEILAAQGALPIHAALLVLRAAARSLAYAHECGIVHRDVKAANILLDRQGRVMVSDFGVALRASDVTLTADGAVIGTPGYMSPEQCAGKRATAQGDQYSLGIVAFQMLAGSLPFPADSLPGIMHHHFFTPLPNTRLARDDVPEELARIVERLAAKAPSRRFSRTRELVNALEDIPFGEPERRRGEEALRTLTTGAVVAGVSTRSLPALPEAPTLVVEYKGRRDQRGGSGRWRWAALAAGVTLAAVGGWIGFRPARGSAAGAAPAPDTTPVVPAAVIAPAPPSAAAPVATGKLRLHTLPSDAQILIDGRPRGVGGVLDLAVAAGRRRLEVRAPGYRSFDTVLTVVRDSTLFLGRVALQVRDSAP